jgi:hypothetical protein
MNTQLITIGALSLISAGFGILFRLKYRQLKTYYKRKCERHDELNEQHSKLIEDFQEHKKRSETMLRDLLAENKRKNEKILAKNIEIQQLKEQAK